jgi:hypothetical protein
MDKGKNNMNMREWKVILHGEHIDTVFFDEELEAEYVLDCLIHHDGFETDIEIMEMDGMK